MMIYYNQWLSPGTDLQTQRNEAHAARLYGGLQPIEQLLGWVSSMAELAVQRWRAHALRRQALSELSGLDDRLLKDLGIARSGIRWTVQSTLSRAEQGDAGALPKPGKSNGSLEDLGQARELVTMPVATPMADNDQDVRRPVTAA